MFGPYRREAQFLVVEGASIGSGKKPGEVGIVMMKVGVLPWTQKS